MPLAQAYLAQRKFQELITQIAYTGQRPSVEYRVRSYQGVAHLGLGELTQARDAFAQAAALAPKAPEPVAGESAVFLRERKFDQSLDRARAALALGPESAEAWNAMGAALHAAGSLREALDAYGKVLALQGSNSEARVSRVGVALDLDDLAEASKELDYLRTNFPSEPRAAYLRSVLLRKQGDVAGSKAAMNAAAQLVAKLPKNILEFQESLLFLGGIANYGLRSFELSEGFLERYIEVRPNDLGARRLLGRIELRQGRNEDAVSLLQPVVEANPDDPRSLSVLATAYSRLGRAADATPLLERALAVDSTNPSTAHQLAVNYIAVKRQRDAISLLRSVLEKHPEAAAPAVTLTTLLLTSGDFDGAAETAERALRSNATQQNLRNLLGVAHTRAGRLAAAREAFEQLRQSSFNYLPARINLAKLDIIEGKPDAGVARFKQILRQFPAHAATMLELATYLSDAGKLNDAIGWVKKSLPVDSKSIPANVFLTNLYLRADNAAGALRVAKETESWAPDSHLVKAALARSYFAVGRRDLATVTLREAATNAGYDARVLIGLAGLQSRIGAWEDADWSLQKALVQEPDRDGPH